MTKFIRRFFEIAPAAAALTTLIGGLSLAIFNPSIFTIIMLLYVFYWAVRIFIINIHMLTGWIRYTRDRRINWRDKLVRDYHDSYGRLIHVPIVPTYKEDISVVKTTIDAIKDSDYDMSKVVVVVAFEERDKDNAEKYAQIIREDYKDSFRAIITTMHPADIEGEIKGKGPNITWAGRKVLPEIQKMNLNLDDVIVTTLDADNRVDKQYFAALSWNYLTVPDAKHKSFQPLPLFFNNIWRVPVIIKLISFGSSFWQLVLSMRPNDARNFAAHAQSMSALVETDFWSTTTIVEDGHQFWRSFYSFGGNHSVVTMYTPVYMDAIEEEGLGKTLVAQYLQRRRWYWGASDIPFVAVKAFTTKTSPWWRKWTTLIRLCDSHFTLATQSILLLMGWLPIFLHQDFSQTVLGSNFSYLYRTLLSVSSVGMIIAMLMAASIAPRPQGRKRVFVGRILLEWVLTPLLLPVSSICFSALPALDSQIRLMMGRPFTVFNVTRKAPIVKES